MDFQKLKKMISTNISIKKPEFINDNDETLTIGYVELTQTQYLIFSVSSFRNKFYFDIRTWFQTQAGEWKPTKKGVHFSFDNFEKFNELISNFKSIFDLAR